MSKLCQLPPPLLWPFIYFAGQIKDWPSGLKVRVVNGGAGGVVVADRPGPSGQPHTLRVDPPVHHLRLQGKLKL